jgi:hypothetical protein
LHNRSLKAQSFMVKKWGWQLAVLASLAQVGINILNWLAST